MIKYIKYDISREELISAIKNAFDSFVENKTPDSLIFSRGENIVQIQYVKNHALVYDTIKINKKTVKVDSSEKFISLFKKEILKAKNNKKSEDRILEKYKRNSFQKNV
jgi:hypothetical protein